MLPIQTLHRHSDSVNTMVVNGDLVLSGSDDTEIKVKLLDCFGRQPHLSLLLSFIIMLYFTQCFKWSKKEAGSF